VTRGRAALLAAALLLTACGGGGDGAAPSSTTSPGDPDSPFCERSREAADEPLRDPFQAGIDPAEVERRFTALAARFDRLTEVAPPSLDEDLAVLDRRLDELADVLDGAGWDFEQLVRQEVDVSLFDDPELAAVAERLAAHQRDVCGLG